MFMTLCTLAQPTPLLEQPAQPDSLSFFLYKYLHSNMTLCNHLDIKCMHIAIH